MNLSGSFHATAPAVVRSFCINTLAFALPSGSSAAKTKHSERRKKNENGIGENLEVIILIIPISQVNEVVDGSCQGKVWSPRWEPQETGSAVDDAPER